MNMDRNTVSRSHASAILGDRRRERYDEAWLIQRLPQSDQ